MNKTSCIISIHYNLHLYSNCATKGNKTVEDQKMLVCDF